MRRRALLAGFVGLSAGCIGGRESGGSATSSTVPRVVASPTTSTSTGRPTVTPKDDSNAYRIENLEISQETHGPKHRYVLASTAFYSKRAVEREDEQTNRDLVVESIDDIESKPVRKAIETAIQTGRWRSNTLPDGLRETVERVDFFTGVPKDDTYTHVGLALSEQDPDAPPSIEFGARVRDADVTPDSPGALSLSLTNVGSEEQEVFAGTVPPFGAVFAEAVDSNERFLLWRPYEKEGCISLDKKGMSVCAIGTTVPIEPGKTVTKRYEVLAPTTDIHPRYTAPPGSGTYRYAADFTYSRPTNSPNSKLSVELQFDLRD